MARRVTIDLDSGIVVAHELTRGCSKSGLYRTAPNGVSRIRTVFLADPSVPAYINLCTVDEDIPEYLYDGTETNFILAAVDETIRSNKKTKRDSCVPAVEVEVPDIDGWSPEDWKECWILPRAQCLSWLKMLILTKSYSIQRIEHLPSLCTISLHILPQAFIAKDVGRRRGTKPIIAALSIVTITRMW